MRLKVLAEQKEKATAAFERGWPPSAAFYIAGAAPLPNGRIVYLGDNNELYRQPDVVGSFKSKLRDW